jgi:glycosyltransferase involved in cell wall biosynthesis
MRILPESMPAPDGRRAADAGPVRTPGDLRVVMFSNLFHPVASGSSVHSRTLTAELVKHGCDVTMITARLTKESPEYECVAGVHIHRLPALRLPKLPIALNFPYLNATFWPANIRRIESILDQRQPDVLHLHNHMFDLGLSAAIVKRRRKLPLLCTIHTMIKHASPLCNAVLVPADRWFLRRAVIGNVDTVISPDANMTKYITEAFRRDSCLIPYGVEAPAAPTAEAIERLRKQHDLAGKRVILSLGHVHEIRNRKDLVAALPAVLAQIPNVVLLIAGALSTQTPVKLAQQLGVSHAVRFVGAVPHADVSGLMAIADLEAHWLNQDAVENTSLGIASLEAMAAGKSIVAAANVDTYGPGVLRNGENCILVAPNEPAKLATLLVDLLRDDARRQNIGRKAAQTIREHFSWNAICRRTIEQYRILMPSSARQARAA